MSSFLPFFNNENARSDQTEESESCFPSLTYKERLIGFFVCFALGILSLILLKSHYLKGIVIEFISFGSFILVAAGKPAKFAICYSFGNVLTLFGFFVFFMRFTNFLFINRTGFLVGFSKQFQNMIDKTRLFSSLVFLGALIMTLVSALWIESGWLVLIFLIIQFLAYVWYVASYIPFARDLLKGCFSRFIN